MRFRPRHALRGAVRLLLVVLLLAVAVVLGSLAATQYLQVDEVELPDVRGVPYTQAVSMLRERNLTPQTFPDNLPGAPVDSVTSQSPAPGSMVRQGRPISLGVNRPPEGARAPDLSGLSVAQAGETLATVGLALERIEYADSELEAGQVVDQRPGPGSDVPAGGGLTLVVSRGAALARVEMPDVRGLELTEARNILRSLGFRSVETIATGVSFDEPGRVRGQDPEAGTSVYANSPVVLTYALSAREVVPVPDVVGRNAQIAGMLIRAAGLQLGEIRYQESEDAAHGAVLSAVPGGHTLAGTPITLVVNAASGEFDDLVAADARAGSGEQDLISDGADGSLRGEDELGEGGRRIPIEFDPASLGVRSLMERDYQLRLVVQDDEGERTVIDRSVEAGESVRETIVVHGDALLQTFINDIFFQAWRP